MWPARLWSSLRPGWLSRHPNRPSSAHPAGDVGLGAAVVRVLENLGGPVVLDEHSGPGVALLVDQHREEGGAIAHPGGLLHVVGDDDDGVLRLDLLHKVL